MLRSRFRQQLRPGVRPIERIAVKPYAGSDFAEYRGFRKKGREHLIVSGVLRRLGFSGFELIHHERPDTLVNFRDANGSVRLGCEIQTLQSDVGASGSPLRKFESRWIRLIGQVVAMLRTDGVPVPYCTVWFRDPSYSSFRCAHDDRLVSELIVVGRRLRGGSSLTFPQSDTPTLNSIVTEIRGVDSNGQDCLWWPTHMKSGVVPALDGAIVDAVRTSGSRS